MTLLVFICNNPEKLEEVLEGYLEVGITGATIIDSLGMGHILATHVPIFAGFQSLFSGASAYNKTIFSVIEEPEKVDAAFDIIEEICGPLGSPGVGIAFTIPLEQVRGLMSELE
ncbi:MAG: P-II family nitrogen regulator [bacterium]